VQQALIILAKAAEYWRAFLYREQILAAMN
jgi:hypothetical protein